MLTKQTKIYKLYLQLAEKYGPPQEFWKEWCKDKKSNREREKVILGAILTQRTNWRNVEIALKNLEQAEMLSVEKIYHTGKKDIEEIQKFIRPSGFYKQKAKRLVDLCNFIVEIYKTPEKFFRQKTESCREKLLNISGIGPETADSILLYAGDKLIFVIDEYTRRFVKTHNLSQDLSYDYLQQLFQKNLPPDIKIYRDYHAMIILEGRGTGWDLIPHIQQMKIY